MSLQNNFNLTHPELEDGEMFWVNMPNNAEWRKRFDDLTWKSKRAGTQAYMIDGTPLPKMFPVFVNKQEVTDHFQRLAEQEPERPEEDWQHHRRRRRRRRR